MQEEMMELEKNETWGLVPLPNGKRPVGYRWVYMAMLNLHSSLACLKALVTKKYPQLHWVNYHDTFPM